MPARRWRFGYETAVENDTRVAEGAFEVNELPIGTVAEFVIPGRKAI